MNETKQVGPAEPWDQVRTSAHKEKQDETALQELSNDQQSSEGGNKKIHEKNLTVPKTSQPIHALTEKEEPKNVDAVTKKKDPGQSEVNSIDKMENETSPEAQVSQEMTLAELEPKPADFHLDQAERLMPESFPHPPDEGSRRVSATIPNVQYLLDRYGIIARYNVIRKAPEFIVPGLVCSLDNADNVAMANIKSLAKFCGISVANLEETILAIADRNQYNPVANWIKSKPWDSIDRLQDFYDTLTEHEDFPKEFKERLVYRWMISAVAANFEPVGFKARGVLTFQGKQGLGKTSWIAALIPDVALRESVIKLDHHLDAGNKDSQIAAATSFIVEIGELESSFRRDVARLKGFITSDCDKIRLPYARSASTFPRRTVFCATVNDEKFLVDTTGNSRWWVIPVTKTNYQHGLEMQQIWAQFLVEYEKGENWWLTPAEEQILEMHNKEHRVTSVVEERVMPYLDLSRKGEDGLPAMTPTELLMRVGYKYVTNPQAKECAVLLREHLGEPKKINGYYKWRIPLAKQPDITSIDDDLY